MSKLLWLFLLREMGCMCVVADDCIVEQTETNYSVGLLCGNACLLTSVLSGRETRSICNRILVKGSKRVVNKERNLLKMSHNIV